MAECPFCKEKVGANDFLPSAEAPCSVCGNRQPSSQPWGIAPAQPVQKEPAITQPALPEPMVLPVPNASATVPTAGGPPPPVALDESHLLPGNRTADHDGPRFLRDRLRSIDLSSALAFLCFSEALLFGSVDALEAFIKPMAGLGLLVGLLGGTLLRLWRKRNPTLPFLLSILCLLTLLFVGSWPSSSSAPPQLVRIPFKEQGMAAFPVIGEDDWVDASANAVKRGDVRVDIVSAQIASVELKDKVLAAASAERFLVIRVLVSYQGGIFQQTPYEPWADRADAPSKHLPVLTDNQDRSYAQKTFGPGRTVVGRADLDALNPGHQVKEVLVYPVPARDVEELRLMLPASAFRHVGAFRFQIPRSMIRGLREKSS